MPNIAPIKPLTPVSPSAGNAAAAVVVALTPPNSLPVRSEDPNTTFLFSDVEGSTRLWEQEPERMAVAMARHDALSRAAVVAHGGLVVKGLGDGVHAIFGDGLDAVLAAVQLQLLLAEPPAPGELALRVRCGMHCGASEARDGDFFGPALNRAARVMGAAHGGQTLITQELAERVAARLPPPLTLADLGVVRLRDLDGRQRLHQIVHPGLRERFPPLRSMEATPNNLAQQLNSFVGRERELAEVRQLLAKTRLLTLLGMGGIGKSRLSVQLGAELMDEYPDGVWLVELAPLTDPRGVPQALAGVLGLKEEAGLAVLDALRAHVRTRTLLVILDNCEHVLHACADLAKQLLQAGAGLKVLATSRDVLQVAGETVYAVPTLTAPAAGDNTLSALARHEAVRLFLDRAQAVQPAFRLDDHNAPAVAEICRRLDGIALALELAAARIRTLSVQAIAARLADRFRLLVTGDQTVLPRQRTLRALIDWSFELLNPAERALFRRLAVFAGGWSLESAEVVCAGDGLDQLEVLDLLAHLVEKSLVTMDVGGTRYRMLETMRAYALEKLADAGDEAATRSEHLGHFVSLAEAARPHLAGPVQGLWLTRLDPERENFIGAFGFSQSAEGGDALGVRLLHALRPYFITRGDLSTGLRLAVDLLARPGARGRDQSRCMALFAAGQFCFYLGRQHEALAHLRECAEIAREADNKGTLLRALQPLGAVSLALGQLDVATRHLLEAVVLARELGDARELASTMNLLALLHRMEGQFDRAEVLFQQVLAQYRELRDPESTAICLLNLAMTKTSSGQSAPALAMMQEVLALASETGSQPVWQSATEVCAGLAASLGGWADAGFFFGAAEAQSQAVGRPRYVADQVFLEPLIDRARAALGPMEFAQLETTGRQCPDKEVRDRMRRWLSERSAS